MALRATRCSIVLVAGGLGLLAAAALVVSGCAWVCAVNAADVIAAVGLLAVAFAFATVARDLLRLREWAVVVATALLAFTGVAAGWGVVTCVAGSCESPLMLLLGLPLSAVTYGSFAVANHLCSWPARALYDEAWPSEARHVHFGPEA